MLRQALDQKQGLVPNQHQPSEHGLFPPALSMRLLIPGRSVDLLPTTTSGLPGADPSHSTSKEKWIQAFLYIIDFTNPMCSGRNPQNTLLPQQTWFWFCPLLYETSLSSTDTFFCSYSDVDCLL